MNKIQKLYSFLEAWSRGSVLKMVGIFFIYAIFMTVSILIIPTNLLIQYFGFNIFTEILYPMSAFSFIVFLWIMFVLIGNRTIK